MIPKETVDESRVHDARRGDKSKLRGMAFLTKLDYTSTLKKVDALALDSMGTGSKDVSHVTENNGHKRRHEGIGYAAE